MAQVITTAGEQLFAIKAQNNQSLDIDTFIFAYVPGQDSSAAIDRNEGLPPVGQRVHQQIVQQRGRVNSNVVIYSTVLDSVTGPFEFNWVGLYSSVNNTLVAISKIPTVVKTVTVPGTAGNILNRNFGIEYSGIADLDGITVDPETWQLDYTARLNGMDELTRQLAADMNGRDWFIDNGFKVAPLPTPNNFKVTAGAGYVSGLRIAIEEEPTLIAASYPQFVYVNAWFDGTSEATWKGQTTFQITPAEQEDYTDETGKRHYLFKLATITAADTVIDHRSGKATSPHPGIKYLLKVPGIKQTTLSFHTGLGVGGGDYIWLPNADQSQHLQRGPHGGILISENSIDTYDGTRETLVNFLNSESTGNGCFEWITDFEYFLIEGLGAVPNISEDQSVVLNKAIKCINAAGFTAKSGKGNFKGNISIVGTDIDVDFEGVIVPFNKSATGFFAKGGFDNGFSVTDITTVKQVVNSAHSATILTRISAPGHSYVIGDKLKVVSEDLITTCLASDNTRQGEWLVVYAVDGNYIFSENVLRHNYTTSPKVKKLLEHTAKIKINVDGKETVTAASPLVQISAFDTPKIDLKVKNNAGIGSIVKSCWKAEAYVECYNLGNNPNDNIFGYGLTDIGNFTLKAFVIGNTCRHVYTTGSAGAVTTDGEDYGEPYYSDVYTMAANCTGAGADTHSQGYRIKFVNCLTINSLIAFQNRAVETEYINCDYDGVWFGYYTLNVTPVSGVSTTLTNCKGKGASGRTFGTASQGGGRIAMTIDSGIFHAPTNDIVEVPILLNKTDLIIKNCPKIKTTGASVSSAIGAFTDSNVKSGDLEIDMSETNANSKILFNLLGNSSFNLKGIFDIPILGSSSARLFSSTDAENAASVDVDKVVTTGISDSRLAQYINGFVSITLIDTVNGQQSSSFKGLNISETTELSFIKSRDPLQYIRTVAAPGGTTLTKIPDGTFSGQQRFIHAAVGGGVNIPNLSNVIEGVDIPFDGKAMGIWQPEGWIFREI